MRVEKCPRSKQDSLISSGNGCSCVFRQGGLCVAAAVLKTCLLKVRGFLNAFEQGSVVGLAGAVGWFVEKECAKAPLALLNAQPRLCQPLGCYQPSALVSTVGGTQIWALVGLCSSGQRCSHGAPHPGHQYLWGGCSSISNETCVGGCCCC